MSPWFLWGGLIGIVGAIGFVFAYKNAHDGDGKPECEEPEDQVWRLKEEEKPLLPRNPIRGKVSYRTSKQFQPVLAGYYAKRGVTLQHEDLYGYDYLDLGDFLVVFDEEVEGIGTLSQFFYPNDDGTLRLPGGEGIFDPREGHLGVYEYGEDIEESLVIERPAEPQVIQCEEGKFDFPPNSPFEPFTAPDGWVDPAASGSEPEEK